MTPPTVSSNVTVAPTAASPAVTLPEIVWVATLEVSAAVLIATVGRLRVEREHDRRAGAGVAGGIGVLGDDGVGAIARQRDGGGPQPARADGRGADLGGDAANRVEQRHGGADRGLAGGDTSGNRLGRDVGGLRGGADRNRGRDACRA